MPRRASSAAKKPRRRKVKRDSAGAGRVEIRGARQNNLKGIDLDLPLNQITVVTGPSGSGKSSLAFQTVYAEGQRRYVETFSPYTRQFFDRMDKPQVDEIRGIPPAIAIEQSNNVRTTRSTVGTITEINDYLKLFFPRVASGFCPECGDAVKPETTGSIVASATEQFAERSVLVTFGVSVPAKTKPAEFFEFLQGQGYLRVWIYGEAYRTDDVKGYGRRALPGVVAVIQDRVKVSKGNKSRLSEAVEAALGFGKGRVRLIDVEDAANEASYSRDWHCASCDVKIRPPTPGLFSFNNPLGACPSCRGFGRTIGIDLDRALPDPSLTIADGVVKAFHGDRNRECQDDLMRYGEERGLDLHRPYEDLSEEDKEWVLYGEQGRGGDAEESWGEGRWYGVQGFFDWQESRSYKMHVRVFLSRFRSYTTCRDCGGGRLQPESLNFKWVDTGGKGYTLVDWWRLPVSELAPIVERVKVAAGDATAEMLRGEIHSRLRYLERVGLGYLDLDRPSRTLSGGEMERVSLTTCLGASLVNTLFVLDEPSIGLHPRDVGRLNEVMRRLCDKGNTLLVVEHEEAVIREADNLVEIGPGRGEHGGELVYNGPVARLGSVNGDSLTAAYLTGAKSIPVPAKRRKPKKWLRVKGARQHNLKGIDVKIPLGVFCAVSGVSGSGKSTLVHKVLYENLIRLKGERSEEEPGRVKAILGADDVGRVVMVDQSPLSRTPRSTPAVYTGAFDLIRKLFAETEEAKSQGMLPGFFSFNSGAGRCERCWGTGYEKVEMQFLSDLYVQCPECEGKRYQAAAMTVKLAGKSICDVLEMTTSEAIVFFEGIEGKTAARVVSALRLVDDVGMGYLRLGQPLNTLSGGESQRLKLVGHLLEGRQGGRGGGEAEIKIKSKIKKEAGGKGGRGGGEAEIKIKSKIKKEAGGRGGGDLLIFDEPTTGLHFDDVRMLLAVFERLVVEGNSILVIEHNLEVLKSADYLIDLGPEAGSDGGEVVVCGAPEEVVECEESHTGAALGAALSVDGYLLSGGGERALRVAEESAGKEDDSAIRVYGAREHNLKDIDVAIPRDELVVVTGLSGSGKSTLAFDILFGEGQRRFLDSMSPYARQFAEQLEKADIDHVTGLPPTVAIEQRVTRGGGKSTVATVTEVYHFLRLLFAKVGTQFCPECEVAVEKQSVSAIVEAVRKAAAKAGKDGVKLQAPLIKARKGFHTEVARWAGSKGYEQLWVDGKYRPVDGFEKLERFKEHSIDVVIATVRKGDAVTTVRDWVEQALRHGKGTARLAGKAGEFTVLSSEMSCPDCGRAFEELDPRLFSYNSPHGWCVDCRGYGQVRRTPKWFSDKDSDSMLEAEVKEEMRMERTDAEELVECPSCAGARINEVGRAVQVQGHRVGELAALSVREAAEVVGSLEFKGAQKVIARDILREIAQRLRFMEEVGLGYLTLDRSAKTLSGGESQRIRLAAQLGSNLRGVLYVLDEPTIGLHPRDNRALLDTLTTLRDQGNSLLVVEHDEDTMRESDRIIDLGPGAGSLGGEVVAQGTWAQIQKQKGSVTGQYLKDPMRHPMRGERRKVPSKRAKTGWLRVKGASANNLKGIDAGIPLGCLTVICGISGSGKSSLMRGVIEPGVRAGIKGKGGRSMSKSRSMSMREAGGKGGKTWKSLSGVGEIEAVYEVDQSPIGKTSRSTPATYVKVFDDIRKLFAQVPTARMRGYTASRFSFNTEGGRCESCKGNGEIKLEMTFMPTSYVPCEDCHGMRYNEPTLEVEYNGKNIGEVMQMTIGEAADFFESNPKISRTLGLMKDTGLGYLTLGQPSPTLSGGEAQRIKLVTELTRGIGRSENARIRQNRKPKGNLYLIEEPSIGLHMADVRKLLEVLHRLVDDGNTVVVIEHNLDIIAEADWVVEIGPEAGDQGGEVVVEGSVEDLVACGESRTGEFLEGVLDWE